MTLARLAQQALVGTRNSPADLSSAQPPELAALLERLSAPSTERTLLRLAAAHALFAEAGWQAPTPTTIELPPCPDDARPVLNATAAQMLRQVLEGFQPGLFGPFLEAVARHGKRLPETLLPKLLDYGRHHSHRDEVMPIVCNVARWLAQHNADWAYALGADDSEAVFREGPAPARREAFKRLRRGDPAHARELLAATWAQEAPDERAAFVKACAVGLAEADEAFLEAALDDRRKEVRAGAAELLARLPGSRLVARAREAALPLIEVKKGMLKTVLEVQLPADCSKAMQRDGIDPKTSLTGMGERAALLAQLIARVPPSEWTAKLSLSAADLLSLSDQHDHAAALLHGLLHATSAFGDRAFALAWLARIAKDPEHTYQTANVLARVLPSLPEAEAIVIGILERKPVHLPHELLACLPTPWSEAVSRAYLATLRDERRCKAASGQYVLAGDFALAALRLAPLADALTGWERIVELAPEARRAVDEFLTVYEFRSKFLHQLEAS